MAAERREGQPVNKVFDTDANWYQHPVSGEMFLSITSALDVVDKPGLVPWAAWLSSRAAIARIPQMVAAMRVRPCGNAYNRCRCKHGYDTRCERCPCDACLDCEMRLLSGLHYQEKSRRAAEGTQAHKATEAWVLSGGRMPQVIDQVAPYVQQYLRFVADYGLTPADWEAAEMTVFSREHKVAGTQDAVVTFDAGRTPAAARLCSRFGAERLLVRLDTKTHETREKDKEAFYPEMPLQLAGYDLCNAVMLPDGTEVAAPKVDASMILQLRPQAYTLRPMLVQEPERAAFLNAVQLKLWMLERSALCMSARAFPGPQGAPAKKAAPRKAAKKAAPATKSAGSGAPGKATARPSAGATLRSMTTHIDPQELATRGLPRGAQLREGDIPF